MEAIVDKMSVIKANALAMIKHGSITQFLHTLLNIVNKASIVQLLCCREVPVHLTDLTFTDYIICSDSQAFDNSEYLGRLQEYQQDLDQVAKEKASLQISNLLKVHKHEFELSFRRVAQKVR